MFKGQNHCYLERLSLYIGVACIKNKIMEV